MGRIRKFGVAMTLAGVLAMGFGTTLSAAAKSCPIPVSPRR